MKRELKKQLSIMRKIFKEILETPELQSEPPILVDLGAGNSYYKEWKGFAAYSICVAFDADKRDVAHLKDSDSVYKKLKLITAIATSQNIQTADFFLTKSPPCSSTLEPDSSSLQDWFASDLFTVVKKVKLPSMEFSRAIREAGVKKIDWFKTDTQGTDLRLFQNIDPEIRKRILVADFEPGIIDAYKGEDKLWQLLKFMDAENFWMADINPLGFRRMSRGPVYSISEDETEDLRVATKASPCWAEVSYFNKMKAWDPTKRDLMLAWIFAMVKKQYAVAVELAETGSSKYSDELFVKMKTDVLREVK